MNKLSMAFRTILTLGLLALFVAPQLAAAQSPQANQALISNFNHITTQSTDNWDGGFTTQSTDNWDGGFVNTFQNNNWLY